MDEKVILLIEDNLADIRLTERAFEINNSQIELISLNDPEKALDFLYKRGQFFKPEETVTPDLILLDINMPKINGKEILAILKSDTLYKSIPIIILTTSNSPADVHECYKLGANMFITKPTRIEEFIKLLKKIEDFWFIYAVLPPKNS